MHFLDVIKSIINRGLSKEVFVLEIGDVVNVVLAEEVRCDGVVGCNYDLIHPLAVPQHLRPLPQRQGGHLHIREWVKYLVIASPWFLQEPHDEMCVVEQLLGLLEDVGVDDGQEVEGALEVDTRGLLRITARRSIWTLQRNICLRVL